MLDLLVVDLGLQAAPVELAQVAQVDALLGVVGHVHALVGEQLLRHVLVAQGQFQQVFAQLVGQAEFMVTALEGGGSHLVQPGPLAQAPGGAAVLELATRRVVVGLAVAAGIADVELLGGMQRREVAATRIIVAAIETTHLALAQAGGARRGKLRGHTVGDDGAANAVAAHADRADPGEYLQFAEVARRNIGQRRVHMVGAGGNQVHAIHLDAQAVVTQPANCRQAGDAPRTVQADARCAAQQAGRITGAWRKATQAFLADLAGAQFIRGSLDQRGIQFGGSHLMMGVGILVGGFYRQGQGAEQHQQGGTSLLFDTQRAGHKRYS